MSQQPFEYNIIKGTESRDKVLQNCYKTYLYELKDKKVQLKLPDDEENDLKNKILFARGAINFYSGSSVEILKKMVRIDSEVIDKELIHMLTDERNKMFHGESPVGEYHIGFIKTLLNLRKVGLRNGKFHF